MGLFLRDEKIKCCEYSPNYLYYKASYGRNYCCRIILCTSVCLCHSLPPLPKICGQGSEPALRVKSSKQIRTLNRRRASGRTLASLSGSQGFGTRKWHWHRERENNKKWEMAAFELYVATFLMKWTERKKC